MLPYCGRSMIEMMMRDLQVRGPARWRRQATMTGDIYWFGLLATCWSVPSHCKRVAPIFLASYFVFLDNAFLPPPQAREFLYFKLTGRQLTTPVAIMTSDAKGNNHRMTQLMESLRWFGRGRDAFKLFRCEGVGEGEVPAEQEAIQCVEWALRLPLVLPWA